MDLGKFNKFRWVDGLLILGIILIIVGIGMNFKDQFLEKAEVKFLNKSVGITEVVDIQSYNEVTIDISGEVINPGVYRLTGEVRVNDILIKAGGLSANADRDWVAKNLNLAEKLIDGEKIFIPKRGDVLGNVQFSNSNLQNKIVRINSATIEQLDTLSGVGPSIAKKIIDYRTKNGGFKNIEELKLVSGIGDKLFEEIKNDVAL